MSSSNIRCNTLLWNNHIDASKIHKRGGLSIQMIKFCESAILKPFSITVRNYLNNEIKFSAVEVYLNYIKDTEIKTYNLFI